MKLVRVVGIEAVLGVLVKLETKTVVEVAVVLVP